MGSTPAEAVRQGLQHLGALAHRVAEDADQIAGFAARYAETLRGGGTLFFAGNGGSAADAQHLATEYVVRFRSTRPALRAIALTTDSSLLTAAGNDLGFAEVFSRQVEALARPGDLLVLHSTSGESENLVRAAAAARRVGAGCVAFLGRGGGALLPLVDAAYVVPSDETSHIQEIQMALEHLLVGLVEQALGTR